MSNTLPSSVPTSAAKKRNPILSETLATHLELQPKLTLPIIRQSTVTTSETCSRKLLLSAILGLRKKGRRVSALDIGSYAHLTVFEMLASGGTRETAHAACMELYSKIIEDARTAIPPGEPMYPKVAEQRVHDLNLGLAVGLRIGSELRQRIDSGKLKVLAREYVMRSPIPVKIGGKKIDIDACGQADLIFMDVRGDIWIFDLKTISETPYRWSRKAAIKLQHYLYAKILRSCDRDDIDPTRVKGVLYGLARKPTIHKKKASKKNPIAQTLEDYILECNEWYDGTGRWLKNAQAYKADPPINIIPLIAPTHSPIQETRIRRTVLSLNKPHTLANFPPSELACTSPLGECEFLNLCSEVTQDGLPKFSSWPAIVDEYYTQIEDPAAPYSTVIDGES